VEDRLFEDGRWCGTCSTIVSMDSSADSSAPVNSAEAVLIVGVSRSLPIFLFVREKRYKKLQRFDAPSILR
jgi:hypothetical protein